MQIEDLPLLELFNRLRQAGLPLGLGEYQLVLRALQAGFGVADRTALANLCRTVWVKSAEDKQIFDYHFRQLMNQPSPGLRLDKAQTSKGRKSKTARSITLLVSAGILVVGLSLIDASDLSQRLDLSSDNQDSSTLATTIPEAPLSPELPSEGDPISREPLPAPDTGDSPTQTPPDSESPPISEEASISEEVSPVPEPDDGNQAIWIALTGCLSLILPGIGQYFIQRRSRTLNPAAKTAKARILTILPAALTQQIEDEVQVARLRQVITTGDYFPVTRRQMKQSWRYLRRMVRDGAPTELDVDATVQAIGRQGMLLQPVFVPRRINRARVILLLDQEGSMAPFHGLSQRLVETAYQGGRLTPVGIYYFHNCPMGYLYHDPDHQQAESIAQVLNHLKSEYTGVLIFSDAGAAHGRWNPERLRSTQICLNQLKQTVRYIVWLNPMPRERWSETTAEAISLGVPMFEFNRHGLDCAIRVLRGQLSRHGEAAV